MGLSSPISGWSFSSRSTFHWNSSTGCPHWSLTTLALKMRPAGPPPPPDDPSRHRERQRLERRLHPVLLLHPRLNHLELQPAHRGQDGSCLIASRLYITCTAPSPRSSATPF